MKYLVTAARQALRICTWSAAAFGATRLLVTPRLPGEDTGILVLAIGVAIVVFFAPALPSFRLRSGEAAACIAGQAAALVHTYAWLLGVDSAYHRESRVALAVRLVGAALGVAVARVALIHGAARVARRLGGALGLAVAGAGISLADSAVHALIPWYEPLTLASCSAELPGALALLRAGGFELEAAVVAALAIGLLNATARGTISVALLAMVVAVVWGRPPRLAGEIVQIEGLQLEPHADTADWRAEKVAQLIRAESKENAITIWPEGSYPFVEALRPGASPAHLPCARDHERIFGMLARGAARSIQNIVVVQPRCGAGGVTLRAKEIAAPFREQERLDTTPAGPRDILVRGVLVALPICYEILSRGFFRGTSARLVVNISADGFDPSGNASRYLTRAAWLRSVEFRLPLVRVSDTSLSSAFDAQGNHVSMLGAGADVLRARIALGRVVREHGFTDQDSLKPTR